MNKLRAISATNVIQTTKFLRLTVRKSKWLISHQAWEEERDFYVDCLRVYIADFSRDYIIEEVRNQEKGQLIELILEWLKTEMFDMQEMLKGIVKEEMIEKFEVMLSLIYALQLCIYEQGQLPLHSFPMTEKEMSWYIEEYIEEKNMVKEFLILTSKGEKIA
jgi:hypothetical protein